MEQRQARYCKEYKCKIRLGNKIGGEELVPLCDGLKLLKETRLNEIMKKYSVKGLVFRNLPVANKLNNRIAVFKLKEK